MALIKCSECGHEISDKSSVCIHCGCPLEVNMKEDMHNQELNQGGENNSFDGHVKDEDELFGETNIIDTDDIKLNSSDNDNRINNNVNDNYETSSPKKKGKGLYIFVGIILVVLVIVGIYYGTYYMNTVEVPALYEVTEANANNILTANSLIPNIVYQYDDYVDEGLVIDIYPYAGTRVDKNEMITVYVSKGPSRIDASDSTISWWHVDYRYEDDWNFYTPYIKDGYLYIDCHPTFGSTFSWKSGGFGNASINDTFSKTVPLDVYDDNTVITAGVEQNFTLIIPVKDLDVNKPTTLYLKLFIERNGRQEEIRVNFNISW